MSGKVGFLYAVTQIHAGKGMDVGVVDQPIQREVHTGFPIIAGIKGAIRNELSFNKEEEIFGSKPGNNNKESKPGNITFSEAKILFFPLRSINRGLVWITCPMVLSRLKTAFEISGNTEMASKINKFLKTIKNKKEYSTFKSTVVNVEEYAIETEESNELKELMKELKKVSPDEYLQKVLEENVIVLKDEDFSFFVRNATEVLPRIRINPDTGTVAEGALWYEEYLPQDTVMFFLIKSLKNSEELLNEVEKNLDKEYINIGGKASVGKGFSYIKLM
ncbi:CRISPR-associated protein Cmr4 [Marinitoga sp. 1135]|uniref:CRISPR type III-B/RAMP module RAMP protein Cmr4 n=1 Tax=Marinitoga piezophila (strain DSM 14283 / JCM 11233 / KA3) TaxID=443254 RepID=H2J4S0_MARPK|nr:MULTISPECIES: type III-B CRISPR module RAMP protein Cmr4 [Marinitoga]AEX84855.1 CRISPR type III-B/RAMP module RAMP protein Cmr4 [Marinitoga piezophila KA3]APT75362.1 CRISPR-associated protein Cmr4 [Marinitoga sp. 1137]NUU95092.1 CRISPR-associated protein Cmr4 [Marinitoga sp. 1135]